MKITKKVRFLIIAGILLFTVVMGSISFFFGTLYGRNQILINLSEVDAFQSAQSADKLSKKLDSDNLYKVNQFNLSDTKDWQSYYDDHLSFRYPASYDSHVITDTTKVKDQIRIYLYKQKTNAKALSIFAWYKAKNAFEGKSLESQGYKNIGTTLINGIEWSVYSMEQEPKPDKVVYTTQVGGVVYAVSIDDRTAFDAPSNELDKIMASFQFSWRQL